ncbi:hypothetical protein [Endozoicomonas sp. YOMI1]|uniref:hypothetical protein n=1 Tax=Endozoicomonas sp. YOMI1 TaxID=2828739 RepID=UPI0021478883|nr:hypothetical protein [Endozoicomonas sp. YOMI1]
MKQLLVIGSFILDAIAKPQSVAQSGAQFDSSQAVDELTGLFGEVLFNHRETRVTTDGLIPETTSQTDLARVLDSSPRDVSVVARSVSMPSDSGFAYSPADTGLRLEYLRKHHVVEGLNNDPDYSALIEQLSHATSDHEKSSLSEKLQEAVERKHRSNLMNAFPLLKDLSNRTNFVGQAFSLINKSDQFLCDNGNIDKRSLMLNVGILDALYSQLTDLSTLLNGELCTESLSIIRYINMIFPDSIYSLDTLNLRQLYGHVAEPSHHKEQVGLRRNWIPDDPRVINVISMIAYYRETELRIYSNISKASAKYLNDYLRTNNIDRLFFPMAGSGYFSKSMIDAGMPSTCFDINPPEKTFTRVNKADVFVSVDKFVKILALTGGNIGLSALVLDAPQPIFMANGGWMDADEFLPKVIKFWFDRGGKNLLVISEASNQELLFSSKALTRMGMAMNPVIPGFTPEIFKGLGEHVGICGLYRIDKK